MIRIMQRSQRESRFSPLEGNSGRWPWYARRPAGHSRRAGLCLFVYLFVGDKRTDLAQAIGDRPAESLEPI